MTSVGAIENFKPQLPPSTTHIQSLCSRSPRGRRTRAGVVASLALASSALAGCGLEAVPVETRSRADDAAHAPPAQTPSAPFIDGAGEAPSGRGVAVQIPDTETLRTISRRAVFEITTNERGFLPSIAAVGACYDELASDDMEARVYCLQLDTAAWFVESMAPQAWQEMDAASNDYFTDARFYERQWREVPPFAETPEAQAQKRTNLDTLDAAAGEALREYLETLAPPAPEKPAPQAPTLQELTWMP